jgi:hypothetical protein
MASIAARLASLISSHECVRFAQFGFGVAAMLGHPISAQALRAVPNHKSNS